MSQQTNQQRALPDESVFYTVMPNVLTKQEKQQLKDDIEKSYKGTLKPIHAISVHQLKTL
jgi:hypothetical protein